MSTPTIVLFNRSTVLRDADLANAITGLQRQVSYDFAPIWGRSAHLQWRTSGPTGKEWGCGIFDDSDVAGALGYHDFTPDGRPLSKVFAKTDMHYGESWTVTTSHELVEMLVDPDIVLTAEGPGGFYAYESADPVEALSYDRMGVEVSDFVTPAYFENPRPGARLDFLSKVREPFEVLDSGYQSIYVPGQGWTERSQTWRRPAVGSRRWKRIHGDDLWRSASGELVWPGPPS